MNTSRQIFISTLFACITTAANAQLGLFYQGSCEITGGNECAHYNETSTELASILESADNSRVVANGNITVTTASFFAGVGYGKLRASVNLSVFAQAGFAATPVRGIAIASSGVTYRDLLTATSDTLPNGSTVKLGYAIPISGSVLGTRSADPTSSHSWDFSLSSSFGEEQVQFNGTGISSNLGTVLTGTFNVTTGSPFLVTGAISVQARAEASQYLEDDLMRSSFSTVDADFSHTLENYFFPLSSDVQIASLSGHDYSLPVPEESTFALLLAGLGAIFVRTRTMRRRDRAICHVKTMQ